MYNYVLCAPMIYMCIIMYLCDITYVISNEPTTLYKTMSHLPRQWTLQLGNPLFFSTSEKNISQWLTFRKCILVMTSPQTHGDITNNQSENCTEVHFPKWRHLMTSQSTNHKPAQTCANTYKKKRILLLFNQSTFRFTTFKVNTKLSQLQATT